MQTYPFKRASILIFKHIVTVIKSAHLIMTDTVLFLIKISQRTKCQQIKVMIEEHCHHTFWRKRSADLHLKSYWQNIMVI